MGEVRDLHELNALQENFLESQGLRKIPIGFFILLACGLKLGELLGWWSAFEVWVPFIEIVTFGAAVWCFWRIGDYYERSVGLTLESAPLKNREAFMWSSVMVSMMFTLANVEPVFVTNLVAGMAVFWMIGSYFRTGKLWPHGSVLMTLVVTMFQLQIIVVSSPLWGGSLALLAMLGLVMIVGGFSAHCQLVKTLGPVPEDE